MQEGWKRRYGRKSRKIKKSWIIGKSLKNRKCEEKLDNWEKWDKQETQEK